MKDYEIEQSTEYTTLKSAKSKVEDKLRPLDVWAGLFFQIDA